MKLILKCLFFYFLDGNQDGKFSVGFRDGVVRTVVGLDREAQAAYTLIIEAIGVSHISQHRYSTDAEASCLVCLIFTYSVFILVIMM